MCEYKDVAKDFLNYMVRVIEAKRLECGTRINLEVRIKALQAFNEVRKLTKHVCVETIEQGFADVSAHFCVGFDSSPRRASVYERIIHYEISQFSYSAVPPGVALLDDA